MTLLRFAPRGAARPAAAFAVASVLAGCGSVSELEPDAAGGNGQDPDAATADANVDPTDGGQDSVDADDTVAFPDDPVLFLPFRDASFADASGNDHGMSSSIAEPAFTADRFGLADRALDLTENFGNDYDMALASDPLELDGDITLAVWIRGSSQGGDERIVGQGDWFTLSFAPGSSVRFGLVDGSDPQEPSVVSPGGHDGVVWTFYAGVVETGGGETTLKLYRDGNLVASDTATGAFAPPPACRFYVGNYDQGNLCASLDRPRRLLGFVDDVRVYDRALSDEEVEALYAEGGWPPG
jgi:hypothetical protein